MKLAALCVYGVLILPSSRFLYGRLRAQTVDKYARERTCTAAQAAGRFNERDRDSTLLAALFLGLLWVPVFIWFGTAWFVLRSGQRAVVEKAAWTVTGETEGLDGDH